MALMEGKLAELNGGGFTRTVQKSTLSIQKAWPGFVPTHVCVAIEEAHKRPEVVEILLANQHKAILPVYGCKTTRPNHVFVCRPAADDEGHN